MNQTNLFRSIFVGTIALAVAAFCSLSSSASASMIGAVDLGTAGDFTMLALTGGIADSGPVGPNADPYTVDGAVGVASSGQTFQASGSVYYNGPVYLHSGDTYNSSAPGVPPPTTGASVDSYLEQASADAFAASSFAASLTPTAPYGTVATNTTITETVAGDYVFDITKINFSGGKTLTLDAPAGSSYVLNISTGIVLTSGSILVAGGLSSTNVLINYTGTDAVTFSGGGNVSQVYGTILAPYAEVAIHPGVVFGSVIAASISMSSGANIVPEVTPGSVIFGFLGLVVAIGSRRALMGRARELAAQRKSRVD